MNLKPFILFVCLICTTCSGFSQRFLTSLPSQKEFLQLSGKPLTSKYGNIASIKVILDTKTKKLYYINSRNFEYHYEFVAQQLHYAHDLFVFNEENYSDKAQRDFLLCNINCIEADDRYFLDLSVFDRMPLDRIVQLCEAVKKSAFCGEKIVFLLNTSRLLALRPELEKRIRTATPGDIYAAIDYQPISTGKIKGRLRLEPHLDSLETPLLPSDILVTTATPEFLPVVRGMLLTEFQTPLSHLVILGQNRKIPIAVYTRLFEDSAIRSLDGQWVELSIVTDTFAIRRTDAATAVTTPAKVFHLTKNLAVDSLIGVHTLDPKLAAVVGNKAANFGLLYEVSKTGKYKTPEAAFGIPFYWYDRHMQQSGAALLIRQLIDHPPADQDSLQLQLKAIQKLIKKSKVDPRLLTKLERRLRSSGYTTFRFRSSTNAEDAAGFSGAGLYDSKTVDLNDSTKTAEEALQKVWASLWSYEAYLERNYFGIAGEDVAMGVLVHRSFPNEAANGVAITKNIYRNSYAGFVINVQKGDVSVVTPPSGVVCDQLVLYPANELSGFQRTIEVITTSSMTDGELVMTKEELNRLQTELERIKRYYWQHAYKKKYSDSYEEFGLDLEFKLDEVTRELYIKQVRVYNY
jgi:pyruvate, water dikinase